MRRLPLPWLRSTGHGWVTKAGCGWTGFNPA
jgi:hypothetical protein